MFFQFLTVHALNKCEDIICIFSFKNCWVYLYFFQGHLLTFLVYKYSSVHMAVMRTQVTRWPKGHASIKKHWIFKVSWLQLTPILMWSASKHLLNGDFGPGSVVDTEDDKLSTPFWSSQSHREARFHQITTQTFACKWRSLLDRKKKKEPELRHAQQDLTVSWWF